MMQHSTKTCSSNKISSQFPVFQTGNGEALWSVGYVKNKSLKNRRALRHASSMLAVAMLGDLVRSMFGDEIAFEIAKELSGRPVVKLADKILAASITHSRNVACVALGTHETIRVGIDVEFCSQHRNIKELALALSWDMNEMTADVFCKEWCLYEARFKATGSDSKHEQPEMNICPLEVPYGFVGMLVWDGQC